ncbi:unnamed protein product [Clavelina lepadiformis]|uniref:SPARC n=1 Tax=Clavelina lepadiformis TaxID=159417 RepID=A0ABP0FI54_CLALP
MDFKRILAVCLILGLSVVLTQTEAKKKRRSSSRNKLDLLSDERLCMRKKCGRKPKGSWCQVLTKNGKRRPTCVCPEECDANEAAPVCSVYGRQYDNKCFLHLEACKKKRKINVAYEGPCIASQTKCHSEQLREFPFRLMDWFVHLKDTDEFGSIDPRKSFPRTKTKQEREELAMWKFESLDKNNDEGLTNKELKRFRFALMPMEHCAKDFFKKCDANKNKKVELSEWKSCLVDQGWEWYQERIGVAVENTPDIDIQ